MVRFTIMMTHGSMTPSTSLSSKRIYTGVNKPLGIGFGCSLTAFGKKGLLNPSPILVFFFVLTA
jgi:hypothetical protein